MTFALSDAPAGESNTGDAYWMARLSLVAYGSHESIRAGLSAIGVRSEVAFFDDETYDLHAFAFDDGRDVVVAFRGTSSAVNWVVDGFVQTLPLGQLGSYHVGFLTAFLHLWDAPDGLRSYLAARWPSSGRASDRRLFLTGHSLGGAVASIAYVGARFGCGTILLPPNAGTSIPFMNGAEPLGCVPRTGSDIGPVPVHAVYTFGAPRIGDHNAAAFAATSPDTRISSRVRAPTMHRYVRGGDPIPTMPPTLWHPARDKDESRTVLGIDEEAHISEGAESLAPNAIARHAIEGYIGLLDFARRR